MLRLRVATMIPKAESSKGCRQAASSGLCTGPLPWVLGYRGFLRGRQACACVQVLSLFRFILPVAWPFHPLSRSYIICLLLHTCATSYAYCINNDVGQERHALIHPSQSAVIPRSSGTTTSDWNHTPRRQRKAGVTGKRIPPISKRQIHPLPR